MIAKKRKMQFLFLLKFRPFGLITRAVVVQSIFFARIFAMLLLRDAELLQRVLFAWPNDEVEFFPASVLSSLRCKSSVKLCLED